MAGVFEWVSVDGVHRSILEPGKAIDAHKWHTRNGVLSVTGPRFMNWTLGQGGGGAIDLVMHPYGLRFRPR